MPNDDTANVTLKDVAKVVGVSAMTVSRALSGKEHLVASDTVRKCREAAERLGYVPNLMARSLRGEQLRTLVLFAEYISSHQYLARLVDITSRAIEQRGYGVISCQSIRSFQQAMRNFNLAGAVIIAPPEQLYIDMDGERSGRRNRPHDPTVVIHSAVQQRVFNEVSPDVAGSNQSAATHLIELGHRNIAYLGGPRPDDEPIWFELRRRGIERALAAKGLPASNLRHQPCVETELAPAAIQQLLARHPQTTAVMCINDEIAVAVIDAARKLGLSVPQNLSVMGCYDIRVARYFRPSLTTMSIDIPAMVETALDLLLDELKHREGVTSDNLVQINMSASLVARESTGPAPAQAAATPL